MDMIRRERWRDLQTARRRQWTNFNEEGRPVVEIEEPDGNGGWPERDTLFFDELED